MATFWITGWNVFTDVGVRAIAERSKYAASLELVARYYLHGDDDTQATRQHRAAIAIDYSFKEGKWFTLSSGKDCLERDTGSLVSLANLTWDVGEGRQADRRRDRHAVIDRGRGDIIAAG